MSQPLSQQERKSLGAFYTEPPVVRFLLAWGLARPVESAMDPSCGDGRFLVEAAAKGIHRLVGCDISSAALGSTRRSLGRNRSGVELHEGDFFALEPDRLEPVDLVVGNPPFIRYQSFIGESRRKALESALRLGVRLSRLTSSWAPFLLHALRFLKPGGSLAVVVPAEITQTRYGLRTLRAVLDLFGSVTLLAFERNLFTDAMEETFLLLAADRGGSCDHVRLLPLGSIEDLPEDGDLGVANREAVSVPMSHDAPVRFAEAYLSGKERRCWRRLKQHPEVRLVASLARVTNGYVTGDNEFFHRSLAEAGERQIPSVWLFPTVRNSRSLKGLTFTRDDVLSLERKGVPHHLLMPREDLFLNAHRRVLDELIVEGEERGTPERFKCRTRDPWWKVPGVQRAEVLVGYMSGAFPKAVVNRAGAFYTNSLHGLRMNGDVSPELVALGFYSSLTLLSLEIEGRSYGGGILKVEPRELDRILLPLPAGIGERELVAATETVDGLLRSGSFADATETVDHLLLREGLGLSSVEVERLREARQRLVERRAGRRKSVSN